MPFPLHPIYILKNSAKDIESLEALKKPFTLVNKVSVSLDDNIIHDSFLKVLEVNTSIRCVEFIIENEFRFPGIEIFKAIRANPNIRYLIFDFLHHRYDPTHFDSFLNNLKYAIISEQFEFSIEFRNLNLYSQDYDSETLEAFSNHLLNQTKGLKNLIFASFYCRLEKDEAIGKFRQSLSERQAGGMRVHFEGINPNSTKLPFYRELLDQNVENKLDFSKFHLGLAYIFPEEVFTNSTHKKEEKMSMIIDEIFSEFNKGMVLTMLDFTIPTHMSIANLKKLVTGINDRGVTTLKLNNICGGTMLSVFRDIEFKDSLATLNLGITFPYSENNSSVIDLLMELKKSFVRGDRTIILRLDDIRIITDYKEKWSLFVNQCRLRTIIYINKEHAFEVLNWSIKNFHIKIYGVNECSELFFYFDKNRYTSSGIMNLKTGAEDKNIVYTKMLLEISNLNDIFFSIKQQHLYLNHENKNPSTDVIGYNNTIITSFIRCCKNLSVIMKTKDIPETVNELFEHIIPFYQPEVVFKPIQEKLHDLNNNNNTNDNDTIEAFNLLLEDFDFIISKSEDLKIELTKDVLEIIQKIREKYNDLFEPEYKKLEQKYNELKRLNTKSNKEMLEKYNELAQEHASFIEKSFQLALNGTIPEKYTELGIKIANELSNCYKKEKEQHLNAEEAKELPNWSSFASTMTNWIKPAPPQPSNSNENEKKPNSKAESGLAWSLFTNGMNLNKPAPPQSTNNNLETDTTIFEL